MAGGAGGSGDDTLRGGDLDDQLRGDAGNDTLAGFAGADQLAGGDGDDRITGNGGDDALVGGIGNDRLSGGVDDDRVEGGLGADLMTGGQGGDRFVFNLLADEGVAVGAPDRISDFASGQDVMDLSAVAGPGFIKAAAFTGVAGQVRHAAASGEVQIDGNGDGMADAVIDLGAGRCCWRRICCCKGGAFAQPACGGIFAPMVRGGIGFGNWLTALGVGSFGNA